MSPAIEVVSAATALDADADDCVDMAAGDLDWSETPDAGDSVVMGAGDSVVMGAAEDSIGLGVGDFKGLGAEDFEDVGAGDFVGMGAGDSDGPEVAGDSVGVEAGDPKRSVKSSPSGSDVSVAVGVAKSVNEPVSEALPLSLTHVIRMDPLL